MKLLLVSALVAAMAAPALAAPAETCEQQSKCMAFTKTKMPYGISPCTTSCVYQVCLTFKLGGSCIKSSSDTLSHTCDMADARGCMRSGIAFDGDAGRRLRAWQVVR